MHKQLIKIYIHLTILVPLYILKRTLRHQDDIQPMLTRKRQLTRYYRSLA